VEAPTLEHNHARQEAILRSTYINHTPVAPCYTNVIQTLVSLTELMASKAYCVLSAPDTQFEGTCGLHVILSRYGGRQGGITKHTPP
jgi:hypothetical protein